MLSICLGIAIAIIFFMFISCEFKFTKSNTAPQHSQKTYAGYHEFDDYFKEMYDEAVEDLYNSDNAPNDKYSIVYITDTGYKYHRADCESLYNSSTSLYKYEALLNKYIPCKKCNP